MPNKTTSGTLFKPELVTEMFSKVKGHSSLAKLSAAEPMPFAGTDTFIFTMDGEAAIVGEGSQKPAGPAAIAPVTIKPIKFVYEGDPIVLMGDPMQNADLTQEYLYGEKYGLGLVLAGGNAGIGRYKTA